MQSALFTWGILAGLYRFFALVGSKSAIHEVQSGLGFLIATVAIGCAGILGSDQQNG
jgi:thiamine transporter ThiT